MSSLLKYILLISCILSCSFVSFSKDRVFFGRIVDKGNSGIPNAVLEAEDRNEVYYCNAKGYFRFTANTDSIDAFIVFSPGYDKKEVMVDDMPRDSIFIVIEKSNTLLKGATVAAKGGEMREKISGISNGGHSYGCYFEFKDEIAVFLKADSNNHGLLKEIGAYITKDGAKTAKFILHVYSKDSATGAPGEDITDSLLAVNARKGDEWVTADLGDKLIQVKGGLFVSVEWTLGYENDFYTWDLKSPSTNYYAGDDSLRTVYNGQVLGLTWGNNELPIVYRKYAHNIYEHTNADKWFLTRPLRGGRRFNSWITPMIYLSYTYFEK